MTLTDDPGRTPGRRPTRVTKVASVWDPTPPRTRSSVTPSPASDPYLGVGHFQAKRCTWVEPLLTSVGSAVRERAIVNWSPKETCGLSVRFRRDDRPTRHL